MIASTHKTCNKCGLSLPLERYHTKGNKRDASGNKFRRAECGICYNKIKSFRVKSRTKLRRESMTDEEKELERRGYLYQNLIELGYDPEWIESVRRSMQLAKGRWENSYQVMNPWEKLCESIATSARKRWKKPTKNRKEKSRPKTWAQMAEVQREQSYNNHYQQGKSMGKWDTKMATTATNWRRKS